jgi:hypothetical protein
MFQYPSTAPRLNHHHICAGPGLRLAAVARSNGALYDLLTGQTSGNGTTYQTIMTPGGPAFNMGSTAAAPTFNPLIASETFNTCMYAAIFLGKTVSASQSLVASSNAYGGANPAQLACATGQPIFYLSGNSYDFNWPVAVTGHLYFAVVSWRATGSGNKMAGTLLDMSTGRLWSGVNAAGVSITGGTYYAVGGESISAANAVPILRAAIANQFISLQQQHLWARKPWSLWHTPRAIRTTDVSIANLIAQGISGNTFGLPGFGPF